MDLKVDEAGPPPIPRKPDGAKIVYLPAFEGDEQVRTVVEKFFNTVFANHGEAITVSFLGGDVAGSMDNERRCGNLASDSLDLIVPIERTRQSLHLHFGVQGANPRHMRDEIERGLVAVKVVYRPRPEDKDATPGEHPPRFKEIAGILKRLREEWAAAKPPRILEPEELVVLCIGVVTKIRKTNLSTPFSIYSTLSILNMVDEKLFPSLEALIQIGTMGEIKELMSLLRRSMTEDGNPFKYISLRKMGRHLAANLLDGVEL